jgi:hypothetical protein
MKNRFSKLQKHFKPQMIFLAQKITVTMTEINFVDLVVRFYDSIVCLDQSFL